MICCPGHLASGIFNRRNAMTLIEAINQVDGIKFNTYSQEDKVRWISSLDAKITAVLEGSYPYALSVSVAYDPNTDMEQELLLESPWDEMYIRWMEAMIDYNNGETESYNRSITMFNNLYQNFRDWYIRRNMPVQPADGFIF